MRLGTVGKKQAPAPARPFSLAITARLSVCLHESSSAYSLHPSHLAADPVPSDSGEPVLGAHESVSTSSETKEKK